MDLPVPALREGMFEGVRHQFVDQETTGDSALEIKIHLVHLDPQGDVPRRHPVTVRQQPPQALKIGAKMHPGEILVLIEKLMNKGYGLHTALALRERHL